MTKDRAGDKHGREGKEADAGAGWLACLLACVC